MSPVLVQVCTTAWIYRSKLVGCCFCLFLYKIQDTDSIWRDLDSGLNMRLLACRR